MKTVNCLLPVLLLASAFCQADEMVMEGAYQGRDLVVVAPEGCEAQVFIDGRSVRQIKGGEEAVVELWNYQNRLLHIRIQYPHGCLPEVPNRETLLQGPPPDPGTDRPKFFFRWLTVDQDDISWAGGNETERGKYFLQKFEDGEWRNQTGVDGKGPGEFQTYTYHLPHTKGANEYRLKYLETNGQLHTSRKIVYLSDYDEVYFYPKRVTDELTFSKKVKYQIVNASGRVVSSDEAETVNCSLLPSGAYTLRYAGKEEKFYKK